MPRRRIWKDRVVDFNLAVDGEFVFRLTGAAEPDPEDSKGMTLVRCIGKVNSVPSLPGASNGAAEIFLGIGLTSEEAFGIGTTAISSVIVEAEAPPSGWLLRTVGVVVNSVDSQDMPALIQEWDLRAQRKLMYGVPFLRIENATMTGVGVSTVHSMVVRSLYLMP